MANGAPTDDPVMSIAVGIWGIAMVAALTVGGSSLIWARRNSQKSGLESKQLHFAAATLTGLSLIFCFSMAMYYWGVGEQAGRAKDIFDSCKTIIPPIVTLILGYYFGRETEKKGKLDPDPPAPRID